MKRLLLAAALFLAVIPSAPARATTQPLVIVLMENKTFQSMTVANAQYAPYINCRAPFTTTGLICQGQEFTNYDSIERPSLPNYLDITSGVDQGCTADSCQPNSYIADNIFHQVRGIGTTASYQETMPVNCDNAVKDGTSNMYVRKHNPEIYFKDNYPDCNSDNLPYTALNTAALPTFSFITPNICHDMHGSGNAGVCPNGTNQLITDGDTWLSQNVPPLVAAGARVIVVWDQGTASNPQVLCVEIGTGVTASVNNTKLDDYGLLAGMETYLGLPLLANAQMATVVPI